MSKFWKDLGGDHYETLAKAIYRKDIGQIEDPSELYMPLLVLPRALTSWGIKNIIPIKVNETKQLKIPGSDAILEIRKILSDIYNGQIIQNGKIIHTFDKIPFPTVCGTLMSVLELYEEVAGRPVDEIEKKELLETSKEDKISSMVEKLGELIDKVVQLQSVKKEEVPMSEKKEQQPVIVNVNLSNIGNPQLQQPEVKPEEKKEIIPEQETKKSEMLESPQSDDPMLDKAKEDDMIAPARKKSYREERNKFESHDPLETQVTSVPGVSDRGIEARRADPKPKSIAHGYARTTNPENHADRAKKYFKAVAEKQRSIPSPNLPKSELDKAEEKPKLIGSSPSKEHMISHLRDRYFYNPKISLQDNGDKTHSVMNGDKKIDGIRVREHKGRWRAETTPQPKIELDPSKSELDKTDHEKGVHQAANFQINRPGVSHAGINARSANTNKQKGAGSWLDVNRARDDHKKVINDLKSMPKPNLPKAELEKVAFVNGRPDPEDKPLPGLPTSAETPKTESFAPRKGHDKFLDNAKRTARAKNKEQPHTPSHMHAFDSKYDQLRRERWKAPTQVKTVTPIKLEPVSPDLKISKNSELEKKTPIMGQESSPKVMNSQPKTVGPIKPSRAQLPISGMPKMGAMPKTAAPKLSVPKVPTAGMKPAGQLKSTLKSEMPVSKDELEESKSDSGRRIFTKDEFGNYKFNPTGVFSVMTKDSVEIKKSEDETFSIKMDTNEWDSDNIRLLHMMLKAKNLFKKYGF